MSPDVNCGLWVMWCQCRFLTCHECTTLVWDVDNGGAYAPVGAKGIWGVSVLPSLHFAVNFKLLCENKVIKIK